ncbi:unnamed protein product, partial [Ixodes hexagonus]
MDLPTATRRRLNYWTSEKEAHLIHLYREHSLLWDSRHPEYYKRDRRDQAMASIANAMSNEFDVVAVKDKIKTLRDYFVKEMKKVATSRKTASQGYVSRWEHFGAWEFLRTAITRDAGLQSANGAAYPAKFPDDLHLPTEATETMILPTAAMTNTSSEGNQTPSRSPSKHSARTPIGSEQEKPSLILPPPSLLKKPRLSTHQKPPTQNGVICSEGLLPSPVDIDLRMSASAPPCKWSTRSKSSHASRNVPEASEREGDEVLFCEHMMSELRQMGSYQKDLSKLRIQQILFEVKHMN